MSRYEKVQFRYNENDHIRGTFDQKSKQCICSTGDTKCRQYNASEERLKTADVFSASYPLLKA
jgi:hypothetical protein